MAPRRVSTLMSLVAACAVTACGGATSSTLTSRSPAPATAPTSSTTSEKGGSVPTGEQPPGPEGIPLEAGPPLGPASSTTPGATVDGVQCAPIEQLIYHIHSHLQVYVDGQPRALPAAIGLLGPVSQQTPYGPFYGAQQCYYWLHTHTSDGVIHIESPSKRVYTLGNFFNEWRQPLTRTRVAGATGNVTAFLNGRPWKQDPRAIPLLPHAVIQLDVGSAAPPPQAVSWAGTSL